VQNVTGAVGARLDRLRSAGHKVTTARRAVLEVLAQTGEHLSADDVAERAALRRPGIHRATVYRALDTLCELGVLTHTHVGRGATTYHLAPDAGCGSATGHLHAQCSACGRIEDLPADVLDDVVERLRLEQGFRLHPEHAALLGVCRDCAAG
jgi:Fur family ferric uptake transcriptional regulator